jgi:hypothetical protein
MCVGIAHSGAVQPLRRKAGKTMLSQVESGMLARQDQRRLEASRGERISDGSQFDRFGPGADDQPDVVGVQPSP